MIDQVAKLKKQLLTVEENFDRSNTAQSIKQIEEMFDIMVKSLEIKNNLSTKLAFETDRDFMRFSKASELNRMAEAIHMNCICEVEDNLEIFNLAQEHAVAYARLTGNLSHFGDYVMSVQIANPLKLLKFLMPFKEHVLAGKILAHLLEHNEQLAKYASLS